MFANRDSDLDLWSDELCFARYEIDWASYIEQLIPNVSRRETGKKNNHHKWLATRKICSTEELETLPAGTMPKTSPHRSSGGERRRKRKHSTISNPWQNEERPSSLRWTLELFQSQCWSNYWETVLWAYGLYRAHRSHFEVKCVLPLKSRFVLTVATGKKTPRCSWSLQGDLSRLPAQVFNLEKSHPDERRPFCNELRNDFLSFETHAVFVHPLPSPQMINSHVQIADDSLFDGSATRRSDGKQKTSQEEQTKQNKHANK